MFSNETFQQSYILYNRTITVLSCTKGTSRISKRNFILPTQRALSYKKKKICLKNELLFNKRKFSVFVTELLHFKCCNDVENITRRIGTFTRQSNKHKSPQLFRCGHHIRRFVRYKLRIIHVRFKKKLIKPSKTD